LQGLIHDEQADSEVVLMMRVLSSDDFIKKLVTTWISLSQKPTYLKIIEKEVIINARR